jgi:hypothetical protein
VALEPAAAPPAAAPAPPAKAVPVASTPAAPAPVTPAAAPPPAPPPPPPPPVARMAPAQSRGLTTDLVDILRGPAQFRGRDVTVQARIGAVLGGSVFVLSGHPKNAEGTGMELLVIARAPVPGGPMDMKWLDRQVMATGRVGTWSAEELERELGQDLDESLEFEVDHVNAVLIADSVAP